MLELTFMTGNSYKYEGNGLSIAKTIMRKNAVGWFSLYYINLFYKDIIINTAFYLFRDNQIVKE